MKKKKIRHRFWVDWNTGTRVMKSKKGKGSYNRKRYKSEQESDFFIAII